MKTSCIALLKAAILAGIFLFATGLSAQAGTLTIKQGQITGIDTNNFVLTVKEAGRAEPINLYITSETRLFEDGDPAVTADLAVGDKVHGTARQEANGKIYAVRIYATKAPRALASGTDLSHKSHEHPG